MKKYILILLMILIVPNIAFAQETEEITETETVPTAEAKQDIPDPTSPLYFFTTIFEEIQMFFTFNDDKKIEKRLEFAEKRIQEMALMAEEGNSGEMDRIRERYERQIAQALKIANKHAEQAEERISKIEAVQQKHLDVLNKVLKQVPEEAVPSIQKVIDKTELRYETDKAERRNSVKTNNRNENNNKGGNPNNSVE